jgi:hypothetical protein
MSGTSLLNARPRRFDVGLGLVALALLGSQGRAAADPDRRLSIGTGLSEYVHGRAPAIPVELSLTNMPFVPFWSVSLGLVASDQGIDYAYVEASVEVLGGGFGYGSFQGKNGRVDGPAAHLSLSLPIPLPVFPGEWNPHRNPWLLYLLPYYRPSWGPWPGTANEVGVMLKIGYLIHTGGCNEMFSPCHE